MAFERISLLRNIGQFDSVDSGSQLPLSATCLIYAENGRGKTTLAAILRSLGTGDPSLIIDRHRLGATNSPHVIFSVAGHLTPIQFQNGTWNAPLDRIAVFDDAFVAANVCSGIEIDPSHRQNLHELILGAQGVNLNSALRGHASRIEAHNQTLRVKEAAIPATARRALSVEVFCTLKSEPNIDEEVEKANRALSAAQAADAIKTRPEFQIFNLPVFDTSALNTVLGRALASVEADAASRVRAHMQKLGKGGEAWISEGVGRIPNASQGQDHESCPFCAQNLEGSALIRHYQVYFSEAYGRLCSDIIEIGQGVNSVHGGDIPAAFERSVRVAVENREFWQPFLNVPSIEIDTASVLAAWSAAREAVLVVLRAKAATPLEASALSLEAIAAIRAYHVKRDEVVAVYAKLQTTAPQIGLVKELAAAANLATLKADLEKLLTLQQRYSSAITPLCEAYLSEKVAKKATETLRDQARAALELYRQTVFPKYQTSINKYLKNFGAGFRLSEVGPVNNRSGSSANYTVLINNIPINLTGTHGPSFKNTLSAGDRNTLALAFFFSSLDHDPNLSQKIVVIDDPMTSLDENRSLTTVQEIIKLIKLVSQTIVLSHSKAFLCGVWDSSGKNSRSAMKITRSSSGSTLASWDVKQDSITEHDRRHDSVRKYLQASDPATERSVAAALRPILEAFVRVSYPAHFPPGALLGPFVEACRQKLATPNEILCDDDIIELRFLIIYANRFHHDTNSAHETAAINDHELTQFCERTLRFAQRR